jgi:hypothetical protein
VSSGEPRDAIGMRAKQMGWKRALVLGSIALLGCDGGGGGGPPPNCLEVQPCGGDLVGRWLFSRGCVADASVFTAEEQRSCPGAQASNVAYAVSGSVTFNADLTYVEEGWESSFSLTVTSDLSCSNAASCAERGVSSSDPDGSFSTTTCSGSTVCACNSSLHSVMPASGTYVVTGTELELTGPNRTRNLSYCVVGSQLRIVGVNDLTGAIMRDDIAQRQ